MYSRFFAGSFLIGLVLGWTLAFYSLTNSNFLVSYLDQVLKPEDLLARSYIGTPTFFWVVFAFFPMLLAVVCSLIGLLIAWILKTNKRM